MINYKIVGKKFEPKEQITLGSQGDNLVETVVFEMNKFHNNIDFSKGSAYIHTLTPAGVKETSLLENISDDEDSDLLKLKWDVGYKHTRFDGRIRFQISIQKEDSPLWASDLGTFIITKSIFDEFNISEYCTREKEPVIIIGRSMHIPENTKTIGVEGDNVSESVTFVADRYYDGQDLFIKKWYVEVLNAEDEYDVIEAKAEEKSSKKINVIWTVTARHTAKAGEVKAKLRVTEKDTHHYIWQSFNGVFVVEETFGEKEIVVDPGLGVIDELLIKAEKIKDEIHEIFESISTNAPKIDEDNEWIIYNPETNEYEKTGVNASGKSPRINQNGFWEVYDVNKNDYVDTGVSAGGNSVKIGDDGYLYIDGDKTEISTDTSKKYFQAYDTYESFPGIGTIEVIYLDKENEKIYYWNDSSLSYREIIADIDKYGVISGGNA